MVLFRHYIHVIRRLHGKQDYVIVKAEKKDLADIEKFAEENIFKKDPLCIMTSVASKPKPSPILMKELLRTVPDDMSYIVKEDAKIVGVILTLARPPIYEPGFLDDIIKQLQDEKERKLMEFKAVVGIEPRNLPKSYFGDAKMVAEMISCAIDDSSQKKGIANVLLYRVREEAKRKGFKFIRAECSNAFATRSCQQSGMDVIFRMPLEDYKDSNGVQIFKNKVIKPHNSQNVLLGKL